MVAIPSRLLGIVLALGAASFVFPGSCDVWGLIWGAVMLLVLYTVVRPLMQAVILPFNMFLFGLLSVVTDGLLVWWTSAWVGGLSLSYAQSMAVAFAISLCWYPYSAWKKRRLRGMAYDSNPA